MGARRSGPGRRAAPDGRPAADEGRAILTVLPRFPARHDGRLHRPPVVTVHRAHDPPAIRLEAGRRVVREPAVHRAVDRDPVIVVEHDELAEAEGSREGARLVRDSFHQAAVAREDPGAMTHQLVPRPVEPSGEHPLGKGHAHCVGEPLAERAGGGLHSRSEPTFGMAGGCANGAAGTASAPPSAGRSRRGATVRRGASSRGRSRPRSGPGRPTPDWPGCGADARSTAPPRHPPSPSAFRDGPDFARSTASIASARTAFASTLREGMGTIQSRPWVEVTRGTGRTDGRVRLLRPHVAPADVRDDDRLLHRVPAERPRPAPGSG